MAKFQKKATIADAMQVTGDNVAAIIEWRNQFPPEIGQEHHKWTFHDDKRIGIPTINGVLNYAKPGDWLVRMKDGTFTVMLDRIFKENYEALAPDSTQSPVRPLDYQTSQLPGRGTKVTMSVYVKAAEVDGFEGRVRQEYPDAEIVPGRNSLDRAGALIGRYFDVTTYGVGFDRMNQFFLQWR